MTAIAKNWFPEAKQGLSQHGIWIFSYYFLISLYKKRSFPLRISSANVTKSAASCDLVTFTEDILNRKLRFLCSVNWSFEHSSYQRMENGNISSNILFFKSKIKVIVKCNSWFLKALDNPLLLVNVSKYFFLPYRTRLDHVTPPFFDS